MSNITQEKIDEYYDLHTRKRFGFNMTKKELRRYHYLKRLEKGYRWKAT